MAKPGRTVLAVITAESLVRLAMAVALGLGIDESYMVVAGRTWQLGYFDHPPIAWWLSHGAASVAGSEAAWVVRLPFITLFAVSTWLMYRLGAALFGPRAGVWAAVTLNLSPVFGVTSGGWVLPDGPLDLCLLAAALSLVRALPDQGRAWRWWLAAGAAAGGALLSKYSAALTLVGALAYLLTQPAHRRWLTRPQPYAAALVAVLLFAPVLVWNARHGWASFAFQGGRAAAEHWYPAGPLRVLGGEALFVLPWLWLPMMVAFIRALRVGPGRWQGWLLCCLGAGPVLLFTVVGLWSKHVLYHWAAPGYLMLFPLLGVELERLQMRWPRIVRGTLMGTAALLVAALAVVDTDLQWNWLPLPATRADDPALQALGWRGLRAALADRGLLDRPNTVFAAAGWQEAGKLGDELGPGTPVVCLNQDAREFTLAGNQDLRDGTDALVISTRPVTRDGLQGQGFTFDSVEQLPPLALPVAARPPQTLKLFIGHRLHRTSG